MADTLMPVPVSNVTFTFSLLIPTTVHKMLPSANQKYFSLMQKLIQQITATDTFSSLIFGFPTSQIYIPPRWKILG
jgi:hypothetical protein